METLKVCVKLWCEAGMLSAEPEVLLCTYSSAHPGYLEAQLPMVMATHSASSLVLGIYSPFTAVKPWAL